LTLSKSSRIIRHVPDEEYPRCPACGEPLVSGQGFVRRWVKGRLSGVEHALCPRDDVERVTQAKEK
jgi:hypothetical protein